MIKLGSCNDSYSNFNETKDYVDYSLRNECVIPTNIEMQNDDKNVSKEFTSDMEEVMSDFSYSSFPERIKGEFEYSLDPVQYSLSQF